MLAFYSPLFLLLLCREYCVATSQVTCAANTDCVVDCTNKGSDCSYYTIDATNALSLTVQCYRQLDGPYVDPRSNPRCDHLTVHCPDSTTSWCRIYCDRYECTNATIMYPQPQNLEIKCMGAASCEHFQLLGPSANSHASSLQTTASIICGGSFQNYGQCDYATFDINHISNVSIDCKSTCYKTQFYLNYATNAQIECSDHCALSAIYGKHITNQLTLHCKDKGCHNTYLDASDANQLNIVCGNYSKSCYQMQIYPNAKKTNAVAIKCSYDCDMNISVVDAYVLDYMRITQQIASSLPNNIHVICQNSSATQLSYNVVTKSYDCTNEPICCPWTQTVSPTMDSSLLSAQPTAAPLPAKYIKCAPNTDCHIDCTHQDCSSYTMDASDALSLILSCNNAGGPASNQYCSGIKVYCPDSTSSLCRIECHDYQCNNVVINYPQPQNLYIWCYGWFTCSHLELVGPDTYDVSQTELNHNATIICHGRYGMHQCQYTKFDVNYIANVDMVCDNDFTQYTAGEHSCYQSTIYANYAINFNIFCHYGCNYALLELLYVSKATVTCNNDRSCPSQIKASDANEIDISCRSQFACGGSGFYTENVNKLSLNCVGKYACYWTRVHVNNAQSVDMLCDGTNSCAKATIFAGNSGTFHGLFKGHKALYDALIFANYSREFEISCIGNFSKDNDTSVCSDNMIYAQHSITTHWRCYGSYACSNNNMYVDKAGIVDVVAYGDHALSQVHLHATDANLVEISCYADATSANTCYDSVIDASSNHHPPVLNCYGAACDSLTLRSDNGFNDWNISMNGCNLCDDIFSCIRYWNSTCKDNEPCVYNGTNCECSSEIASFINNKSLCNYPLLLPTSSPTEHPITSIPTHQIMPTIAPTIGAESGIWSTWYGGPQCPGNTPVEIANGDHYINKVCVRSGSVVNGMNVSWNDGTTSQWIGGMNAKYECYSANENECFSSVTVTSDGTYVYSIQFGTSDDQSSPTWGVIKYEHQDTITYGSDHCISKYDACYGWYIDKIKFYFIPKGTSAPSKPTTNNPTLQPTVPPTFAPTSGIWTTWYGGPHCPRDDPVEIANGDHYIHEICTRSGDVVDAMNVSWTDGTKSQWIGGNGGEYECYSANKNECFSSVTITSDGTYVVNSIQFGTSDGQSSPMWGVIKYEHHDTITYGADYCIAKYEACYGGYVDKIKFYFIPKETAAASTIIPTITPTTLPSDNPSTSSPTISPTNHPTLQPIVASTVAIIPTTLSTMASSTRIYTISTRFDRMSTTAEKASERSKTLGSNKSHTEGLYVAIVISVCMVLLCGGFVVFLILHRKKRGKNIMAHVRLNEIVKHETNAGQQKNSRLLVTE